MHVKQAMNVSKYCNNRLLHNDSLRSNVSSIHKIGLGLYIDDVDIIRVAGSVFVQKQWTIVNTLSLIHI